MKNEILNHHEKKQFNMLDAVGSMLTVLDPKGRIIYFNKVCIELTGYSKKDVAGKHYWDVFLDKEEVELAKAFFSGLSAIDFPYKLETLWYMKDGTTKLILWSNTVILDNKEQINCIVCTGTDVTKQKEIENNLRETNTKMNALIHTSPVAIISLDTKGIVRSWSTAAERTFGWLEKDVVGKNIPVFNEEEEKVFLKLLELVLEGKYFTGEEVVCTRKDGLTIDMITSGAPLRNNFGEISGIMVVADDISKRKEAERQIKASLQEKEVLLKEIHHRVKNNLQVISSLLKLQAIATKDNNYKVLLEDSQHRIKAMALIHEKLYASKDLSSIDMKNYVCELVQGIKTSYGKKMIKIHSDVEASRMDIDLAIPCGLIINELLSNSFKYAFPGDIPGNINISIKYEDSKTIALIVSDDGVGMSDDIDYKKTQSLGLQLVYSLAEDQLHGKIELEREQGTTFKVKFVDLNKKA